MKTYLSAIQVILIIVVGIIQVITHIDSIWSGSVDLAHHYALAYRISEDWTLSSGEDPSLGEMNYYPRISHILAAIAGLFFNSTFLGIQIVSLSALALLWGAVIYIYNSLSSRTAFISSIGLMCLMIVNRSNLHVEIHGAELVSNFFFSQLVAQAIVVFAIAVATYLEIKKSGNYVVVIFLIVTTYIVTGIHLLPALELLGVVFGVIAINIYLSLSVACNQRAKLYFWYTGAAIAAVSSVVLSPSFKAFKKLSENNGSISFAYLTNPTDLILLCISVLAVSGVLLNIWIKNRNEENHCYIALKFLGLYGASVSLLCLVQIAALNFGYGSEYATKKYAFGLFSHLFISIPILVGIFWEKTTKGMLVKHFQKNQYLTTLVVLVTYSTVFNYAIPKIKLLDASDIVALEHKLIAISNFALPAVNDKSNVVVGLANMPATISYMFSIAVFRTPVSIAIPDILVSNRLNDINNYTHILTSVNSTPYYRANCNIPLSAGSIAILDAACIKQELESQNACVGNFDFTLKGSIDPSELSGFSIPEDHGRWTEGKNAKFSCIIKGKAPRKVKIDATPFLYSFQRKQRLIVTIKSSINNYELYNTTSGRSIEITLPASKQGEKINIELNLPDAISPKQVGFNEDTRQLGVSIKSISFQ